MYYNINNHFTEFFLYLLVQFEVVSVAIIILLILNAKYLKGAFILNLIAILLPYFNYLQVKVLKLCF